MALCFTATLPLKHRMLTARRAQEFATFDDAKSVAMKAKFANGERFGRYYVLGVGRRFGGEGVVAGDFQAQQVK
jgi:hypothetical protein